MENILYVCWYIMNIIFSNTALVSGKVVIFSLAFCQCGLMHYCIIFLRNRKYHLKIIDSIRLDSVKKSFFYKDLSRNITCK